MISNICIAETLDCASAGRSLCEPMYPASISTAIAQTIQTWILGDLQVSEYSRD